MKRIRHTGLSGKWALITGASSGFGVEFADLLAARGANLVLVARRTDLLEQLAERLRREHEVRAVVEGIDLSQPGAGTELKRRVDAQGIRVDVLVNNAGYGMYGDFVLQPLPRTLNMVALNVVTVTELTRLFAADMVQRGAGHILLIASLLGFQAVPGFAAYAASKAFVLNFGEALHAELAPRGVTVTVLAPGPAGTGFVGVAGQPDTWPLRRLMMRPGPVVRTGLSALWQGRASVVAGVWNKLIVFSSRFTPRWLQRRIMGRVFVVGAS